jgi:hypothetical protein
MHLQYPVVRQLLESRAAWLYKTGDPVLQLEGEWLHNLATIYMGDLGEEQEEIEVLPLHEPSEVPETVPAEPDLVPA